MSWNHESYRRVMYHASALLLILLAGCLGEVAHEEFQRARLDQAFYIWQRVWTDDLRRSVQRASGSASSWMLLCGEFENPAEGVVYTELRPDWQCLASTKIPVTLVFRVPVAMTGQFASDAKETAALLAARIADAMRKAEADGVAVAGYQLDYDCPTRALGDYASVLAALRRLGLQGECSITALPTWLSSKDFGTLVNTVDYYVLQVHSLSVPKRADEPVSLCNADLIPGYLQGAARIAVPFRLALPTYGYEIVFDGEGAFAGLRAESGSKPMPPSYTLRRVMANPSEMAPVVADMAKRSPESLAGLVWFRLPVEGDRYCWDWDTMAAVMRGEAPIFSLKAELCEPEPGLYEVWIAGGESAAREVVVEIRGNLSTLVAYDLLHDFNVQSIGADTMTIRGHLTQDAARVPVAWLRFKESTANEMSVTVREAQP